MVFLHRMAFLLGQLSLQAALFEISVHIQETVFLHDMAFLLGQLSLESALFEISIHIQERFFFIIWPFSWVSLVCNQLCFFFITRLSCQRSDLSEISFVCDQLSLRSALSEISSV